MTAAIEISRRIVSGAIGLSIDEVTENSSMFSLPGWDSVAHMKIILAAEEHLGRTLEPQSIVELAGVRDLARLFEP